MLRNTIYYGIKPFIPKSLRTAIRRRLALRLRDRVGDTWPIIAGSERPPENWPGWPGGKKFAVVLTHDVEGTTGVEKCEQLMRLEMELGFRSCFNFIPEGTYQVPSQLREELVRNGFEVGVHDLNHDGRLYRSRREFSEKAKKINYYLEEWGAVGFRSGFMLHNLDWFHALDIEYDMSTFDTDPFEPQPEGRHTIFPFWVPRPETLNPQKQFGTTSQPSQEVRDKLSTAKTSSEQPFNCRPSGYVELPYTLPQDSTLFLLLRERNPDIWLRKLDWIAEHGGIALIATHPDYMAMNGSSPTRWEYPVAFYERLLEYLHSRYSDAYWHTLPKEVAAFSRKTIARPEPSIPPDLRSPKYGSREKPVLQPRPTPVSSILMIAYTNYRSDARVIREAEAAVSAGFDVDFIALRRQEDPEVEMVRGVRVIHLKQSRYRGDGRLSYMLSYLGFFLRCFVKTSLLFLKERYRVIHVNNMPDFFVFCTLVPKLMGAKIMLDIHDPMPDTFASKFKGGNKGFFFKLLLWQELLSAWYADRVITVHDPVKDGILVGHGLRSDSIHVIANFADDQVFRVHEGYAVNGKLRLIFHGSILERYGLRNLILALSQVRNRDKIAVRIIGEGDFAKPLTELITSYGLGDVVQFENRVYPMREIPRIIAESNLGLVPMEISAITNYILPVKLLEYISTGMPVLTVRNKAIAHYFSEDDCLFYQPDNPESLRGLLDRLTENPSLLLHYRERALAIRDKFLWSKEKEKYVRMLQELTQTGSRKG